MAETNSPTETPGTGGSGSTVTGRYGTNWADLLFGTAGIDKLFGLDGDDKLHGGAGGDIIDGGQGWDTATYWQASARVNIYLGHMGDNTGDASGDTYYSIEAVDGSIYADTIEGDSYGNTFWGDAGNDFLVGLAGSDRLCGGAGNDKLVGGLDADYMNGGEGFDTVSYWYAQKAVKVYLDGSKQNMGEAAGDVIVDVEVIDGSRFGDILVGDAGANAFWGDAGDDLLDGGAGADVLSGGAGFDSFYFTTALGGSNVDQITDFNSWDDGIMLSTKVFTGILSQSEGSHLVSWQFTNGTKATSSSHRIIYDKVTGDLYFDKDGSGATAQVKFATLEKGLDLSSSNFFTYNPELYSI